MIKVGRAMEEDAGLRRCRLEMEQEDTVSRRCSKMLEMERAATLKRCKLEMQVHFVYQVNTINGEGYDSVPMTSACINAYNISPAAQGEYDEDENRRITLNLYHALCAAEAMAEESSIPYLRVSDILRLHRLIFGNRAEWLQDAGCFRRRPAYVRLQDGSFHEFAQPNEINRALQKLLARTNAALEDVVACKEAGWVGNLIQTAVTFFLDFELIHPFRDGNGRVGRVLLAYLLFSVTPFGPNNIYSAATGNITNYNLYKSCFQEAGGKQETRDAGKLVEIFTEGICVGWLKLLSALGMPPQRIKDAADVESVLMNTNRLSIC